jgi:hypothetical protein
MRPRNHAVLSLLLWLLTSGVAVAATPPAKVVQQFIEAHLQGRYAEARGFTIEQVNLSTSIFSGWLFGAGGARGEMGTADIFLSRQFAQTFRYNIIGTVAHGDNQVSVTAVRASPNLTHLYTWALAPKQGAAPYALIEAIDAYLTKVNFPIEESRMEFTLIRETDEWYISAISDEKFMQLQQQWLPAQPLALLPPSDPRPSLPGATAATPAVGTTTTDDSGRQVADAQFNATMQSFNRPYQPPVVSAPAKAKEEEKPSFLDKIANVFSGSNKKSDTLVKVADASVHKNFLSIRDALAIYAANNNGFPGPTDIYDWQSLRKLVNRYSKKLLPATEAEAGFSFVDYRMGTGREDYTLLVELQEPQDGITRVEVTAYGVDRVK